MKLPSSWLAWCAYSLSASVHGLFLVSPPEFDLVKTPPPPPSLVQFTVTEPKPEPELPAEPEPTVEAEPIVPKPQPQKPEPEPEPEPAVESAPESEPVSEAPTSPPELTGTTLTGADVGSWSAEAGSGRARSGALIAGVTNGRAQQPAPSIKPAPPAPKTPTIAVEALKDLLKRPTPPNLGDALKRNYPLSARSQGQSGEAKVRARVDADGRIRVTRLVQESSSGFGRACENTLTQSRWSPPINRKGVPVATWINYRCSFVVD